jgi:hypothetical protein
MGTFATRQEPAEERTGADTEIRLWPEGGRAYGYRQATAGTSSGCYSSPWGGSKPGETLELLVSLARSTVEAHSRRRPARLAGV